MEKYFNLYESIKNNEKIFYISDIKALNQFSTSLSVNEWGALSCFRGAMFTCKETSNFLADIIRADFYVSGYQFLKITITASKDDVSVHREINIPNYYFMDEKINKKLILNSREEMKINIPK